MKVWNNKFLLLWVTVAIISLIAAVHNATLYFDDLYLVGKFKNLQETRGWLHSIYYLFFNLDLGLRQFRLYGISRVLHFLLWGVFGNNAVGYTVFIALTQVLTGLCISKLIVRLRYSELQATAIGLAWALSPFAVTSCFHYYSYLILPWQIVIINALLLCGATRFLTGRIPLFILLGAIIALTGESHLVASSVLLILVALGTAGSASRVNRLVEAGISIFSTMVTIVTYKFVWGLLLTEPSARPDRFIFSVPSLDDFLATGHLFLKSFVLGVTSQIVPVLSIAGLWICISFFCALVLVFLIKTKKQYVENRVKLQLPLVLALIFICSLAVNFALSLSTGLVSQIFPRRYGFVPCTIGTIAIIALMLEPYVYRRLKGISFLVLIFPLWIWMTLQMFALPTIRGEDNNIWRMVTEAMEGKESPAVLFVNAWYPYTEPDFEAKAGSVALRGYAPEIFESNLAKYWPQLRYATLFAGAEFAATRAVETEKNVRLMRDSARGLISIELEKKQIVIVQNTSVRIPPWESAIQSIKVFSDWDDDTWQSNMSLDFQDSRLEISQLIGKWYAGAGTARIVIQPDGSLMCESEKGNVSPGSIIGNTIVCHKWKVSGKLTRNGKVIVWNNGFRWAR